METITVNLNEIEKLALSCVSADPVEFITNFAKERARLAASEISEKTINYLLENNISIPNDKLEIIKIGFSLGVIKSAKDIKSEQEEEIFNVMSQLNG